MKEVERLLPEVFFRWNVLNDFDTLIFFNDVEKNHANSLLNFISLKIFFTLVSMSELSQRISYFESTSCLFFSLTQHSVSLEALAGQVVSF